MIQQTVEQGSAIARAIEATAGYYVIFGLTDDLKDDRQQARPEQVGRIRGVSRRQAARCWRRRRRRCRRRFVDRPLRRRKACWSATTFMSIRCSSTRRTRPPGSAKGYFRLLAERVAGAERARLRCWTWNLAITALVLVLASVLAWFASQIHRPADPGAGDDRPADCQGRSHAARRKSARATRSGVWPRRSMPWPRTSRRRSRT